MSEIEKVKAKKLNADEKIEEFQRVFEGACREFWGRKLIQVCGQDVTLLPTVFIDTDLQTLLANMLFDSNGKPVHRVALMKQAEVSSIITQSDVLKFLNHHQKEVGDCLNKTIEALGMYNPVRGVVTITEDVLAMEAFHMMYQKNLSCLGIVDKDGKLTGNVSASDLRGLVTQNFSSLSRTVTDFLKISKALSRPYATVLNARLNDLRTLCVKKGSTFKQLLDMICKNRVHRVYVVNEKFSPIGLITLSDVISVLSKA